MKLKYGLKKVYFYLDGLYSIQNINTSETPCDIIVWQTIKRNTIPQPKISKVFLIICFIKKFFILIIYIQQFYVIGNFYSKLSGLVKWKGVFSNEFKKIRSGPRQGGEGGAYVSMILFLNMRNYDLNYEISKKLKYLCF